MLAVIQYLVTPPLAVNTASKHFLLLDFLFIFFIFSLMNHLLKILSSTFINVFRMPLFHLKIMRHSVMPRGITQSRGSKLRQKRRNTERKRKTFAVKAQLLTFMNMFKMQTKERQKRMMLSCRD